MRPKDENNEENGEETREDRQVLDDPKTGCCLPTHGNFYSARYVNIIYNQLFEIRAVEMPLFLNIIFISAQLF